MSLTDHQVHLFLETKLGFGDWKSKLNGDKLIFLRELVRRYAATLYFENITLGARGAEERRTPTIAEVIEQIIETAGGVCVHLNYFMMLLLQKLGFNAYVAGGKVPIVDIPNNHMVTLVRLPLDEFICNATKTTDRVAEEFELYLIDVGFARPITDPISLHPSKLPYKGKAAGFHFEFRHNPENNLYERIAKGGCSLKGKFETEAQEKVEYFFDSTPLEFKAFEPGFRRLFTNPSESFLLYTWILFRLTHIPRDVNRTESGPNVEGSQAEGADFNFDSDFDFKYISCLGRSISMGSKNEWQHTTYASYSEMVPVILELFPNLNPDTVCRAASNFESSRTSKE